MNGKVNNEPKQESVHELEPTRGFPEPLPKNENLIWQGSPDFWFIAKRVFYVKQIAFYFALIIFVALGLNFGKLSQTELTLNFLLNFSLALTAMLLILGLSFLISSTAVYSLTNKRLVMRIGVVLTVTLNIPFNKIEAAELKKYPDGSGDISIKLASGNKIAYPHLWPHCRGWFFSDPRPRLTGLKKVENVANHFAKSWGLEAKEIKTNEGKNKSNNDIFVNTKEIAL